MLQAYVSSVSDVLEECFICFPDACCKCVYMDVAYISHIRCMHFIWMLPMVAMVFNCVLGVFSSVSEASFKCFNCLQTYIATVVFGCFKSRSVLHLSSPPSTASSLPTPAGHSNDAAAGSFRIGGAARPSPLVAWAV